MDALVSVAGSARSGPFAALSDADYAYSMEIKLMEQGVSERNVDGHGPGSVPPPAARHGCAQGCERELELLRRNLEAWQDSTTGANMPDGE